MQATLSTLLFLPATVVYSKAKQAHVEEAHKKIISKSAGETISLHLSEQTPS
jgi:hypothetical protein